MVACLLTAAILAVYWRLIGEGLVLAGFDTQTYFYPYWTHAFAALRGGELPLWNPHLFMGAPLLANPQAAVLYLPNWIILPMAPERALGVSLILHVALAAGGAVAVARRVLGLGWPAAGAAGAVFALGGFFAGQAGHVNQVSAAAWLPWLTLGLDRMLARAWRWWFITPPIVGLLLLAGHPQEAYIALVFALAYAALVGVIGRGGPVWERLRGLGFGVLAWAAAAAVGALLAAAQLLPTLELSRRSIRAESLSAAEAASFSLPVEEALSGFLPTFLRLPSSTEYVAYIGFAGAALAALGIAARTREPRAWLLVAVIVSTILVSFGPSTPVFGIAHRWIPGFDLFRVPPRWLLLMVFSGALLAAYGTEALAAASASVWRSLRGLLLRWAAGLAILAALALWLARSQLVLAPDVGWTWALAGLLTLAVLAALFVVRGAGWRWIAPIVVAAELVAASWPSSVRAAVPDEAYAPDGPMLAELRERSGNARILGLADPSFEVRRRERERLAPIWFDRIGERSWREFLVTLKHRDIFSPNLPLAYGLRTPDGYDGGVLPLASYIELRDALIPGSAQSPDVTIQSQLTTIPSDRVLDTFRVGLVLQNRVPTLEFEGAHVDLRFPRRVAAPLVFDGLDLPRVSEVIVVIDAQPGQAGATAGLLRLFGPAGRIEEIELRRSPHHSQRVSIGPGHLVSVRPGLERPAFYSAAPLDRPLDIHRVELAPSDDEFDLRGLTLVHADGSSTSLAVGRPRVATTRVVGDVVLLTRQPPPIAWLPSRVQVVWDSAAARAGVASPAFDPATEAWIVAAGQEVQASGPEAVRQGVLGFLRSIGAASPAEHAGMMSVSDARLLGASPGSSSSTLEFPGVGAVRVREEGAGRMVLEVETEGEQIVVLPETMYPGWSARVNGAVTPVWQANLAQRAVLIPRRGLHTLELEYRSAPFEFGRAVSLASFGLLVVLAGIGLAHRRRV